MLQRRLAAGVGLTMLLPLVGLGQPAQPAKTIVATASVPFQLPLLFSLNVLPQHLSVEDSLNRPVYVRNHVKTVTLLRLRPGRTADTAEYTELDRRGNQVLVAKPFLGQHRQQVFDKKSRLVESSLLPTADYRIRARVVYDPKLQLHSTYIGPADGAAPVLWQQAQQSRRGDTLRIEAVFKPVAGWKASPVARLRIRQYHLRADTTLIEVVGYDSADQPIDFSMYYSIGKPKLVRESGMLDFRSAAQAPAPAAAELVRLQPLRRARFVPNIHNEYDAKGRVISASYMSDPNAVPPNAVTSTSTDGQSSITIGGRSQLAGHSIRYSRLPDGRVQREDQTYDLWPDITDANVLQAYKPSSITYEYGSNGLLLRKTNSASLTGKPTEYEVKYTYY